MSKIFRIQVLPAQRGDALWIEYGSAAQPFRILIDGGITKTGREHLVKRVEALDDPTHIDLLIVTHIDLDHIQGVIELLKAFPAHVSIDRVWFNGWDQLDLDPLVPQGVKEGIELSELLEQHHPAAWNVDSDRRAVAVLEEGTLPGFELPGDMKVTVLSPNTAKLLALKEAWDEVVEEFGAAQDEEEEEPVPDDGGIEGLEPMGAEDIDVPALAESPFAEDKTVPNGSSIAVMLEFAGKRALMLADAHPSLVLQSLKLLSPAQPLKVDCVKLAHHGSKNNSSRALIKHLRSKRWIFSSNGATTKHPSPEAVARVLHDSPGSKTLFFNYKTKFNDMWDSGELMGEHDYAVVYGDGVEAVVVDLIE